MNENSMRDVIIYYAHDLLGYTGPELAKIYGVGPQRIRQIVAKVRDVEMGKQIHGPTKAALKQIQRDYPVRQLETIKRLRDLAKRLIKNIDSFMSATIAYAPEIQDTPFLDGIYCVSDNLENWQDELNNEIDKFFRHAQ